MVTSKPTLRDVWILSAFTILATLHPFFLHQNINLFELGYYLPGIDALLRGEVPYRDFVHLRGPFELYLPALLMQVFGKNVAVLSASFYVGTVLTLIICIFLAATILQSRLFLYLLVPTLVAKTFPRVVFTYWGGFRFAWGLLAVLLAIYFFKRKKLVWMLGAGIMTALGFWTSIEIGVCAGISVIGALVFSGITRVDERRRLVQAALTFAGGFFLVTVPYVIYLAAHQALGPFIDTVYNVIFHMQQVVPQTEIVPKHIGEVVARMVNPASKNFRHLTPVYCYLALLGYLGWRYKKGKLQTLDTILFCLAGYGVVFYVTAFRNIWSSHFQMALQPEKILYFFLLERFFFCLKDQRTKLKPAWVVPVVLGCMVLASIIYPLQRMNRRLFAFHYLRNVILGKDPRPLYGQDTERVSLQKIGGMVVPQAQARDLSELAEFFQDHTVPAEPVLMYPELGAYSFIVDRPFVGRFPVATLSWFNDQWHREYLTAVKEQNPSYAVLEKQLPAYFETSRFQIPANQQKYDEVMAYIRTRYTPVAATPNFRILQLK